MKRNMLYKKTKVDNSSQFAAADAAAVKVIIRCGVAMLAVACILVIATPHVLAQKAARRKPKAKAVNPPPQISKEEAKKLAEAASQSRANLLNASSAYRESLEKLIELQRQEELRATEIVAKRKELLALGVISKRELEESERALAEAQSKIAESMNRVAEVDHLVAEVTAAEELAKTPVEMPGLHRSAGLVVRYVGASRWALSDLDKVDAFFRLKFGRPLPLSAVGQTETHNQLGFDHREAVDVAVHPDSAEGQALIGYLTSQGVSFIAIRGAIRGSATGAHVHIGLPSKRISAR